MANTINKKNIKELARIPYQKKIIKAVKSVTKKTSIVKPERSSSIQKRSTIGVEVEFFILNKNGRIINKADQLLDRIKKNNKGLDVTKEVGKNMIEVGCYPDLEGINSLLSLSENLETLLYAAEEMDYVLCPLGTYPGKNNPETRNTDHYKIENKLFGKNAYMQASRASGLHIHYALPWGVYDFKKHKLKKRVNSKHKQCLVNSYNFLIAADPALSTFAQSSPFFQGSLVGKDARALIWRGDSDICFSPSLYNQFPVYGELPSYQHTGTDLINFTEEMYRNWNNILLDGGIKESDLPKYKSILETNWTPLRLSYHGTLEQRGMDINTPLVILALSRVIQNILRAIQEDFVKVYVSDKAIDEPFKYENNSILIPPFTYVKNELQRLAFLKGLDNDQVYRYAKRLLWLARELGVKKDENIFDPLEAMLSERKTTSDNIIALAKKLGHKDMTHDMPADIAAQIALEYSSKLFKEMVLFRELVKRQVSGVK
jgi:hypothetical protein